MIEDLIPDDLCTVHHRQAVEWRDNVYLPHRPAEWPGGLSAGALYGVMDSRTSHEERAAEFARKNAAQVELVVRVCRSGRSPQCSDVAPGDVA